jgi:hypothetical protein
MTLSKLSLAIGLVVMWLTLGCGDIPNSPEILFEVPTGSRGFMRLVQDRTANRMMETDKGYLIRFGETGILRVKSIKPLRRYFKGQARYSDGTAIPFASTDERETHGVVFWLLYGGANEEVYFFLGTREEAVQYVKEHPEIYQHQVK